MTPATCACGAPVVFPKVGLLSTVLGWRAVHPAEVSRTPKLRVDPAPPGAPACACGAAVWIVTTGECQRCYDRRYSRERLTRIAGKLQAAARRRRQRRPEQPGDARPAEATLRVERDDLRGHLGLTPQARNSVERDARSSSHLVPAELHVASGRIADVDAVEARIGQAAQGEAVLAREPADRLLGP